MVKQKPERQKVDPEKKEAYKLCGALAVLLGIFIGAIALAIYLCWNSAWFWCFPILASVLLTLAFVYLYYLKNEDS